MVRLLIAFRQFLSLTTKTLNRTTDSFGAFLFHRLGDCSNLREEW